MNDKMTFHRIADSIAAATGGTAEEAATFLRALLDKSAETLARGEKVNISGIGTFAPGETSEEAVLWAPDRSLADAVNEPFAAFEAVPLANGITEQQLSQPVAPAGLSVPAAVTELPSAEVVEASVDNLSEPSDVVVPADEVASSDAQVAETIPEPIVAEMESSPSDDSAECSGGDEALGHTEPSAVSDDAGRSIEKPVSPLMEPSESVVESVVEPSEPKVIYRNVNDGPNPWIMLLVGVVVGLCMGYFLGMNFGYLRSSISHDTVEDEIELLEEEEANVQEQINSFDASGDNMVSDEAEEIAAPVAETAETEVVPQTQKAESPKVITDTVDKKNYLTTMARKYYGNHCFWVYIYEENAAILKNPDLIRPGTVVVIPPAEKYGIDASDPESVRRATAKIAELEHRFKGKR